MSISLDMMHESILQTRSDKMIPRYALHKPFMVSLLDRGEWNRVMVPLKKGGLTWCTDMSKTNESPRARIYAMV
jgi:hypothetical protein